MANNTETLQSLDDKINNIKEVLQRKVSQSDEQSLRRMLMAAMQEKKIMMQSELSSLQAKYGVKSDVIVVDSPPPPTKCKKDPPGQYMKEAAAVSNRRKRTESQDDPDFEITPPRTKKKLSLQRKKTVINVDESEEEELHDPRRTPARGKGKGKGKGPAKKTAPPPPSPSPTRASDSDSPAPPPQTKKRRVTPKKNTPAGKRRDNPWCSSSSDEGGTSGIPYTLEEMNAMYDTMEAEDPDVVTGKTGHLTRPEKNSRLKALFKKVKRSVNAVGGSNRRKKYLWVKVTDHKSKTILKKKDLVKKYGYSGAGGMPEEEGLTQIQMRCLNFHGIECAAWARKTELDRDDEDEDAGSEGYEQEFKEAEKEQAAMIEEYKASRRNTTEAKKEEEHNLAALQKKYKMEPVKKELTIPEPTKADKDAAKGRRPGRPQKRGPQKASTVLHNSGAESDHEETPKSETPKGRGRGLPEPTDRQTRSSERLQTTKDKKVERAGAGSIRSLDFPPKEEDDDNSSGLPEGFADVTEPSMVQDFDEGGDMDYAVHFTSPNQVSSRRRDDSSKTTPVSSTPKEDIGRCSVQADKQLIIKITPLGDMEKDLRTQDDDVEDSQSKEESLPSPTVEIKDESQHLQPTTKVPSTTKREAPKQPTGGAGTSQSQPQQRSEDVHSSMSDRRPNTQAEFVDMRIQETVNAGFQVMQADWNRQSTKFINVEEQLVSLRVDVQKNQAIPSQLRALTNEFALLQSSMSALNGEFVQMQADISNISEEATNSRSDLQSTKANVVSMKADTTTLKGDTHILKSKIVANTVTTVAVQSQLNNMLETQLNIAHELKTLKTDMVLLHGNLMALQSDMASVKKEVVSSKSELSCISNGIEHLTRLITGGQVGQVMRLDPDIHVKSDSDVEGGAQVTAPPPAVASTSGQQEMDRSVTESELNNSEVTFKPTDMQTYERAGKPDLPKSPRKSARTSLFNLTDSNIEEDTQDTQETQDPNLFVDNTEFTEDTEPSQSMGWPDKKDLQGTPYGVSSEPEPTGSTSSPKPTTSKDKPTIEEGRGTFVTVVDTQSGRSMEDPVSLVPAHCVRDMERRLSKPTKTRSKSASSKKSNQ